MVQRCVFLSGACFRIHLGRDNFLWLRAFILIFGDASVATRVSQLPSARRLYTMLFLCGRVACTTGTTGKRIRQIENTLFIPCVKWPRMRPRSPPACSQMVTVLLKRLIEKSIRFDNARTRSAHKHNVNMVHLHVPLWVTAQAFGWPLKALGRGTAVCTGRLWLHAQGIQII